MTVFDKQAHAEKKRQGLPRSTFLSLHYDEESHKVLAGIIHDYKVDRVEFAEFSVAHCPKAAEKQVFIETVYSWLKDYAEQRYVKLIACSVSPTIIDHDMHLLERMWLELDIVPILYHCPQANNAGNIDLQVKHLVKTYYETPGIDFTNLNESCVGEVTHNGFDIAKVRMDPATRQVYPQFLTTLDAYGKAGVTCTPEEFKRLRFEADRFKKLNGSMIFLNSTGQGGGVALMRHALIRMFKLLDCNVDWHVLLAKHKIFNITKIKFHNMLQGVAPRDVVLTQKDKEQMEKWSAENAEFLLRVLQQAKVIVCDDYQPSGLIPLIKQYNPDAKIIYRSHIHVDSALVQLKNSPQSITWNYIWDHNQVKDADLFLSHPIAGFVPQMVPRSKIVLMPATTDPLDGLNKPLSPDQINYYLRMFNNFLRIRGQIPLDLDRPYIIQTARFDPSKGIPDVLESYRRLRHILPEDFPLEKTPQLVLVGHGSIDDPESEPMMAALENIISLDIFDKFSDDIKRARMPHNDQVLNALVRGSSVALQLSHKEGLEVKVSENLLKGKPVILYNVGGMPLQVKDEVNSFVISSGQTHQVAECLKRLFMDDELMKRMSKNAQETVQSQFFTVSNCINWLFLANELMEKGKVETDMNHIQELLSSPSSSQTLA